MKSTIRANGNYLWKLSLNSHTLGMQWTLYIMYFQIVHTIYRRYFLQTFSLFNILFITHHWCNFSQVTKMADRLIVLCESEETARSSLNQKILGIIFSGTLLMMLNAIENSRRDKDIINVPKFSPIIKYLSHGSGIGWECACAVHVGCMCGACGVHVGCMWGACEVHVGCMCSACGMHVGCIYMWCMCSACAVHVRCMWGACAVHVWCMCSACVVHGGVHEQYMWGACAVHGGACAVHVGCIWGCICSACGVHVQCMSGACAVHVGYMCGTCVVHVRYMCGACAHMCVDVRTCVWCMCAHVCGACEVQVCIPYQTVPPSPSLSPLSPLRSSLFPPLSPSPPLPSPPLPSPPPPLPSPSPSPPLPSPSPL